MQYVMTAQGIDYTDLTIPEEAILPVEEVGETFWKVVSGPYEGKWVHKKNACPLPMFQELLQRREEVAQLMQERDELRAQLEQRKPALPREVAEAIEKVKASGHDIDFLAWTIAQDPEPHDSPSLKLLKKKANEDSFLDLVDALRYGYTVEDPNAEKRARLLENLAKIGYEGESAQTIVDTIAPIIFETESEKSG